MPWLPGETLFSICARHHRVWGTTTSSQSARVLFGDSQRAGTYHDLPGGLGELEVRAGGIWGTFREIAVTKTLLSFYRPFLSVERIEKAIALMKGPSVAHLKYQLGLLTSGLRANHPLKACSMCMCEDRAKYGWTYWHLEHQFPGVLYCELHGKPLTTSQVKANGVGRFLWFLPSDAQLEDASSEPTGAKHFSTLVTELQSRAWQDGELDPARLKVVFRARLSQLGAVRSANGRLLLAESASSLLAYAHLLRQTSDVFAWTPRTLTGAVAQVHDLVGAGRQSSHPLRWLLGISWLFRDFVDFLSLWESIEGRSEMPSDELSLPDLESVEPDDGGAAVMLPENVRKAAQACQAAISLNPQRGPKRSELVSGKQSSAITRLASGESLGAVSEGVGVSVADLRALLRSNVGLHDAWKAAGFSRVLAEHRETWLKRNQASDRAATRASYQWLYKHDAEWLGQQPRRSSVDWQARDQLLAGKIDAYIGGLTSVDRERLRLWSICQRIPELRMRMAAIDRLPMTAERLMPYRRARAKR
ncbi:TnsD family Tn7-like transposition protein [Variovorax sp. YR216]|uniref:TnsD family Tn7-like transposition protein n=1 Tax=Variovorax sp. YR216 TaxID=1882828 RepID=UPI0035262E36